MALLSPEEFVVAILRVEGLNDGQIAELLGASRWVVRSRMLAARRRIVEGVRESRGFFEGRERRPLEGGWICSDPAGLREVPEVP